MPASLNGSERQRSLARGLHRDTPQIMSRRKPSRDVPRALDRPSSETDFAKHRWVGAKASELFFGLRSRAEFQGLGDKSILLPAHSLSISRQPQSGGSVVAAFQDGLEFTDQISAASGLAMFGALLNLPLLVIAVYLLLTAGHIGLVLGLWSLMLVPITVLIWFLVRLDTIGYRYAPVLFDRAAMRVHVFYDEATLFQFRPFWGGGRFEIRSFEWACVRGQVSRFSTFTGNFSQQNAALTGIVIKAPDDAELVGQFAVGTTTSALNLQLLLDRWEHIRRFMEHEGPLFVAGDGPPMQPAQFSFANALLWGQPMLGRGGDAYRSPWHWGVFAIQIVLLPLMPFTVLLGLVQWSTYQLKAQPRWPAEILASVGGHRLNPQELDAWRNIVPARAPSTTMVE